MITAGEPQEFIPLGREHLKVHPEDVYLSIENVPAAPAANDHSLTRDLLKALRGVSLKDQAEEHWFLKENINDDAEEEFYWNGKTVIWSKSSGHGVKKVQKSFTMENNVLQVLWTEFRIRSCKPRIMDAVIEMETENHEALCGVCVVENSAVSVFSTNGEDYIVSTPFEVLRAWTSRYGIIFERNLAVEKKENVSKQNQVDDLPVIFSMMHPLDDIAPVIKRRISANIVHINYFCDSSEDIVFCCSDPSLVMTYNKKGFHSVWKLRTTTFQEADYACSKIQMTTPMKMNNTSTASASKSSKSKLNISSQTPSLNASSPYHSYHSSRVASPASMQGRSFSPGVSHLTHMATLSRSQPPSQTNSLSHPHGFTPLSAPSRNSFSASQETDVCKFMEPLAPDICFDHEWSTDLSCIGHQEKASKVFLSKDITGHSYLCYFLKEQQSLQLIKFEENKSTKQWVFGSVSSISTLDAEALPDLDLIITVDSNFTLTLYTGTMKICKVHVADIFGPINDILTLSNPLPPISYTTPKRISFIASTRPPSASSTKFGDESQILSPVPMIIEEPTKSVLNEEMSFFQVGPIKGIRDSVRSRVTLETSAGYYRLQIPKIAVSKTVSKCLKALKYVLPRDIYTQVFIKWYSSRNAPGPNDMDTRSELNVFLLSLLGLIGFDNDRIVLGDCIKNHSNVPAQVKKLKTHEKGCDDDWYFIMSLNNHKQSVEFKFLNEASIHHSPVEDVYLFNDSALLFPYIAHVLFAIHLVYEDCKLDITLWNDLCQMCSFLCELARELRQYKYLDHYCQDFPEQFKSVNKHFIIPDGDIQKVLYPSYFAAPPSIYHYINTCLTSSIAEPFPYIPNVTRMLHGIVLVFAVLTSLENPVFRIKDYLSEVIGLGVKEEEVVNDSLLSSCYSINYNPKKAAVYLITKLGFTIKDINSLPIGLALPIKDALLNCWHEPSGLWSKDMFDLIGRRDLSSLQSPEKLKVLPQPTKSKEHGKNSSKDNFEDGLHHLDLEVLRLRFDQDHRVHDVFQMLQSSKPVQISLVQRPEVSDHEFIEEQERHLYNLCIRTMAATVGRGMFTLRAYNPVVTEALPIPKLCLTGRAPPRNTTVDLSHIDVPPNMNMWPLFHNGVAAGLSISFNASKIVSKHAFQRGVTNADVDYETMSQAYCNIIAGGCFCLGLKFAGSANAEAFETLMQYAKHFLSLSRKHVGDQAGEQAGRSTIETCLNVVVLSLAMVMAGTGDLDVIRICRHLRSRISQAASYVLYGSHMVTHMALGLLFLGGGRFTLSTSPLSIGAMICAFFPKFPQHSNDNRYHLQAFYHLYVLAVEPRLIVPRLIDSNKPVYINMKVSFKDTPYYEKAEFTIKAPCILPELKFLKRVVIEDPRYWPIVFDCDENWDVLRNLLENGGTLHVMQNAGCLPYSEDPQGFRSLLAQSYIWNNVHAWNIKNVQISDFSSDPVALKFASCFLSPPSSAEEEKEWQQKICGFLFECASLEKMEALPICVSMIQMAKLGNFNGHTFDLWQIKMVSAYENWIKRYSSYYKDTLMLLRPDFGFSVSSVVERSIKKASIGLKNHLLQYITQNWTPVNNTLPDYPSALAGFILFHDLKGVNSPNLQSMGEVNLPALYDRLRNFNLSTSSVMSVLSVLSS
ncbi:anaphase-promoting complex subunit 1 [Trichonephila inaurata madagascariensis]|uniref:Anaphase-promoting complex subunit 1 n=1 Tax=Trichonephila inaurata madagascariensis TaxID=2747483 RepID=A0A8X6MKP5_9ARAC|nr:anaphase-promoting complex subunit 1 [Trichonephila inaurata madagascariensis]